MDCPQIVAGSFVGVEMKKEKLLGPSFCVTAALIWGLSFVAQSVGKGVGTLTFTAVRMIIGGLVMIPFVVLEYKKKNKNSAEKIPFDFKGVLIGGGVCGTVLFVSANLQQEAFNYLEAGKVGFITALYMILVPVFGLILKQRPKFNVWIGVVIGIVGLYFICMQKSSLALGRGEFITILCAIGFAIHILVIDHFCTKVDTIALSCTQYLVAGIFSAIFMFIFEEPNINDIMGQTIPILYCGIGSCSLAFTFQIYGQKYAEPAVASLLLCLESVFSVIAGWIILDQALNARTVMGCVIMFIGIIFTQISFDSFKKVQKG